nr:site-specific integrase [Aeromonas veronii]
MDNITHISFSKERLLALPLPDTGKRTTYHDTKIQGLQFRVSSTGTKTFCVYRRMKGGQPERVTLGRFPAMTVEQARKLAAGINAEIEAGSSPAAARRAIREEPSFTEVFEQFLVEKKKRDGTHIGERTKRDYRSTLCLYLGSIKSKKLSHITRADIKTIHTKTTKISPAQADRALAIVSAVYNFAANQDIFGGINPASRIQKNPAPSRDRFAQKSELPQLFVAIAESNLADFFLLSLLTGARRSNVQEMTWRDLDLDAGVWRISMTKNGTSQDVALSPEAVEILVARKLTSSHSIFVFPGEGKTGHLVEPKKAWSAILRRASLRRLLDQLDMLGKLTDEERQQVEQQIVKAPVSVERQYRAVADELGIDPAVYDITDLHIHDLRRTLGSWQAKTGSTLPIIGKSLNHKSLQATAIYARLDLEPVRQSVETATQAMMEAAGIKQATEVELSANLPAKIGCSKEALVNTKLLYDQFNGLQKTIDSYPDEDSHKRLCQSFLDDAKHTLSELQDTNPQAQELGGRLALELASLATCLSSYYETLIYNQREKAGESRRLANVESRSYQDVACAKAKEMWAADKNKEYRVGDMAKLIHEIMIREGYFQKNKQGKVTPTIETVRGWIKHCAPEYAHRRGKLKTR